MPPLEFNGREDSIFQAYNLSNQKFMEYVAFDRIVADIPVDHIVEAWREVYGEKRVNAWIRWFEETGKQSLRDFEREEILFR